MTSLLRTTSEGASAVWEPLKSPRPIPSLLLVSWGAVCLYASVSSWSEPVWLIGALGSLGCVLVTLPTLRQAYDFASIWTLVVVATYIGCGLRSLVVVGRGIDDPIVQGLYLRGQGLQAVETWGWLYVLGLALLTIGFVLPVSPRSRLRRTQLHQQYEFSSLVSPVVVLCALLGAAAFWSYIQATGGLDLESIAAKRTRYTSGAEYGGSQGVQRAFNELASVALLIAVARNAISPGASPLRRVGRGLALLLLTVNALALPFYSSTRAQVVYTLLTALVVHVILRGRLRLGTLAVMGGATALLVGLLTVLRQQNEGASQQSGLTAIVESLNDAFIWNLNFTELFKSVNIMAAIPDKLAFTNGTTLTNYLMAPIPRTWWPEKPIIDAGVDVGVTIYGTDGTSIPPGLIGEAYWAFGVWGVVLILPLMGVILRRLETYSLHVRSGDPRRVLIYAAAVYEFGGTALGGSLGNAILTACISAVLMAAVLALCGRRIDSVSEMVESSSHAAPHREREGSLEF